MKNLLLILALAGAFNYVDGKQSIPEWTWYSSEVGEFKVLFPNSENPEVKKSKAMSWVVDGDQYISKRSLGLLGMDDLRCEVLFGELQQISYDSVDTDYEKIKSQMQKELLADLVSERDFDWLGYSAKEYVFYGKVSKALTTVRTFHHEGQDIFAQLIFTHPKGSDFNSEKERFFDSFQLL